MVSYKIKRRQRIPPVAVLIGNAILRHAMSLMLVISCHMPNGHPSSCQQSAKAMMRIEARPLTFALLEPCHHRP
jgi:multisubunit Na+/H+ antiporter MnhC subunit